MAEPAEAVIERRLRALTSELAYPETPPLAASVTSRLLSERAASRSRRLFPGAALWTRRRTVALAVAGLLFLGGAAVAGRLAIGAVGIRIVPKASTPPATGTEASLGRASSLAEAADVLGFEPAFPPSLGPPDDVRIARTLAGPRVVVLAWRAGPSDDAIQGTPWTTLLMEVPGHREVAFKEVYANVGIEPTFVGGSEALWIEGPHELVLITPNGERHLSVAAHTLVWEHGDVTYRLETLLPQQAARTLAETIG